MPRTTRSKSLRPISEKTRESDERLRQELVNADPEKFKRLVKPLFRSPSEESDRKKNEAATLAKD
jgi:hypothetical protein